MSDLRGSAASNTFRIRDVDALRRALDGIPILVRAATPDGDPNHIYLRADTDDGCWPTEHHDERNGRSRPLDLLALIVPHLAEDEVAVLKEAGAHDLREISANARAVNERGERAEVDIADIYPLAEKLLGGQIAADI
jgi:hypothetical protein